MKDEATPKSGNIEMSVSDNTANKPPIKIELCLTLLIQHGEKGITQPEAYTAYHESCLHTSISSLQKQHGLEIARLPDKATAVHYRQKAFSRYWLADDIQIEKATNLLNFYRSKRGLAPLPQGAA